MKRVIWLPTASPILDPRVHGEWVDYSQCNAEEAQQRWALHNETNIEKAIAIKRTAPTGSQSALGL